MSLLTFRTFFKNPFRQKVPEIVPFLNLFNVPFILLGLVKTFDPLLLTVESLITVVFNLFWTVSFRSLFNEMFWSESVPKVNTRKDGLKILRWSFLSTLMRRYWSLLQLYCINLFIIIYRPSMIFFNRVISFYELWLRYRTEISIHGFNCFFLFFFNFQFGLINCFNTF